MQAGGATASATLSSSTAVKATEPHWKHEPVPGGHRWRKQGAFGKPDGDPRPLNDLDWLAAKEKDYPSSVWPWQSSKPQRYQEFLHDTSQGRHDLGFIIKTDPHGLQPSCSTQPGIRADQVSWNVHFKVKTAFIGHGGLQGYIEIREHSFTVLVEGSRLVATS